MKVNSELMTPTKIYIHCSYSEWGSVKTVRKWHTDPRPKGNGWTDIGYHFVVHNQFTTFKAFAAHAKAVADERGKFSDRLFSSHTDGQVVAGRPLSIRGAHVKHDNAYSVGICYIGISPTVAQFSAMLSLCRSLILSYPLLNAENVFGHREYWINKGERPEKTCPNFDLVGFRTQLLTMVA